MEDIKKILSELETKINKVTESMDSMKGELTQTFIHNFDKLVSKKEEVKEEVKDDEVKQEENKLEDF